MGSFMVNGMIIGIKDQGNARIMRNEQVDVSHDGPTSVCDYLGRTNSERWEICTDVIIVTYLYSGV